MKSNVKYLIKTEFKLKIKQIFLYSYNHEKSKYIFINYHILYESYII